MGLSAVFQLAEHVTKVPPMVRLFLLDITTALQYKAVK